MWKRLFGSRSDSWIAAGLLLRLAVGVVFAYHGWGKVLDLEGFIEGVRKQGILLPEVLGPAAAVSEFLGGICVVAGFATRLWALLLSCVMAIAVFKVHWAAGMFGEKGYEYPLVLGVACLALLLMGPGKLSVDDRL